MSVVEAKLSQTTGTFGPEELLGSIFLNPGQKPVLLRPSVISSQPTKNIQPRKRPSMAAQPERLTDTRKDDNLGPEAIGAPPAYIELESTSPVSHLFQEHPLGQLLRTTPHAVAEWVLRIPIATGRWTDKTFIRPGQENATRRKINRAIRRVHRQIKFRGFEAQPQRISRIPRGLSHILEELASTEGLNSLDDDSFSQQFQKLNDAPQDAKVWHFQRTEKLPGNMSAIGFSVIQDKDGNAEITAHPSLHDLRQEVEAEISLYIPLLFQELGTSELSRGNIELSHVLSHVRLSALVQREGMNYSGQEYESITPLVVLGIMQYALHMDQEPDMPFEFHDNGARIQDLTNHFQEGHMYHFQLSPGDVRSRRYLSYNGNEFWIHHNDGGHYSEPISNLHTQLFASNVDTTAIGLVSSPQSDSLTEASRELELIGSISDQVIMRLPEKLANSRIILHPKETSLRNLAKNAWIKYRISFPGQSHSVKFDKIFQQVVNDLFSNLSALHDNGGEETGVVHLDAISRMIEESGYTPFKVLSRMPTFIYCFGVMVDPSEHEEAYFYFHSSRDRTLEDIILSPYPITEHPLRLVDALEKRLADHDHQSLISAIPKPQRVSSAAFD